MAATPNYQATINAQSYISREWLSLVNLKRDTVINMLMDEFEVDRMQADFIYDTAEETWEDNHPVQQAG